MKVVEKRLNGMKISKSFLEKNAKKLFTSSKTCGIIKSGRETKIKSQPSKLKLSPKEEETKMKMVKNLSKVIVKNYEGFNLREDLNFSDDGNHFRGFDYKGLPITTLRSNVEGCVYLSIRVDYLDNDFTYYDWMETEEYKLANEFNGVSEFDIDKLIENCERIIAKVNELNEKARNEAIDTTDVEEEIHAEAKMIEEAIEYVKANLKWWNLKDGYLKMAKDYMNSLIKKQEMMLSKDVKKMSNREKKEMVRSLEKYGYVYVKENDFYIIELKDYVEKSNEI